MGSRSSGPPVSWTLHLIPICSTSSGDPVVSKLFILLKAPNEYHSLDLIAALGGDDRIGVILFEDATLFSVIKGKREELLDVADAIYVIDDDLEARGFAGRAGNGYEVVDYPRAVDLIMQEYEQTITL